MAIAGDRERDLEGASFLRRWSGLVATVIALAIWLALALNNPRLTYHFAPLIAAGAGPAVTRMVMDARVPIRRALALATIALVLTLAVTGLLMGADSMEGPSLWDDDSAEAEAVIFAIGGAVVGGAYAAGVVDRSRGRLSPPR